MIKKYVVGIDIAKKDFKACLIQNTEENIKIKSSGNFSNNADGLKRFNIWVSKHLQKEKSIIYVMEATGTYHEQLAWFLFDQKQTIHVVLPNRAKAYMISLGQKSKNDKVDAKGLAMMGATQKLDVWAPISKKIYNLRGLTRHLEDLQSLRTALKNQRQAIEYGMHEVKEVTRSIDQTIKTIDKQIEKCKQQIHKVIDADEKLSSKVSHMISIKGVSTLTAAVILSETNGFSLIKNIKQLVSYAGYDVRENQSGMSSGKTRITKKGNAHIRRAMHLPAFNMVRYDVKTFSDLYHRVYNKSGIKMKAYVAIQRKLLCLMYTLWKKNEPFNPKYTISEKQESMLLPSIDLKGVESKTVSKNIETALDELPCDQSPEVLFSIS